MKISDQICDQLRRAGIRHDWMTSRVLRVHVSPAECVSSMSILLFFDLADRLHNVGIGGVGDVIDEGYEDGYSDAQEESCEAEYRDAIAALKQIAELAQAVIP